MVAISEMTEEELNSYISDREADLDSAQDQLNRANEEVAYIEDDVNDFKADLSEAYARLEEVVLEREANTPGTDAYRARLEGDGQEVLDA